MPHNNSPDNSSPDNATPDDADGSDSRNSSPSGGGSNPPSSDGGSNPPPSDGGSNPSPSDGGSNPPPSDGGSNPSPSEGGNNPSPTEGGNSSPPSGGGNNPSPSGGGNNPTPSGGGNISPPSGGGNNPAPSGGGGGNNPPSEGGNNPSPSGGGGNNSPSGGGNNPTPSGGGNNSPSGGGNSSPSSQKPGSGGGNNSPSVGKNSSSESHSTNKEDNSNVLVGVIVGSVVLLLVVGICLICSRRKKRKQPYYYGPPDPSLAKDYLFHTSEQGHSSQWNNYYNSGQHPPPHPNWQGPPSGPHGMDHVVRVQQNPNGGSGVWGAPHPLMNSGEMSSNYSYGMGPPGSMQSSPGLSLTLKGGTFTYEELASATKGFANENIIGQGGFGYVHKGILPTGKEIAVKSLKAGSGQGEREFQAEIDIISRVHHRHLVSLVGYCVSGGQRMLVYEFVPNKTLEYHLHGKGVPTMDWPTRMRIALGSARGLAYLHEDCSPRIIHRDIKAANVLIDDSFEAKVADFGLAKLTTDTNTHVSTRVMGTFGYMAPEYASSGKLTEKSDVFSFGVMLLELLTGKRPLDLTNAMDESLVDWARPLLSRALEEDGNYAELVDPFLEGNYDHQEMIRLAACAASSIRHSAKKRSKMSQIVRALEGDVSLEDLKESMIKSPAPQTGVYTSSGSEYDTMQYNADMAKFRKQIMSGQEFDSGEH